MNERLREVEEELTVDKLVSGDRPSVTILGLVGAQSIRETQMAVFMVDVLGRVRLMPSSSVKVLHRPRIEEEELHQLLEDEAIRALVAQGDSEDEILSYLSRRKAAET